MLQGETRVGRKDMLRVGARRREHLEPDLGERAAAGCGSLSMWRMVLFVGCARSCFEEALNNTWLLPSCARNFPDSREHTNSESNQSPKLTTKTSAGAALTEGRGLAEGEGGGYGAEGGRGGAEEGVIGEEMGHVGVAGVCVVWHALGRYVFGPAVAVRERGWQTKGGGGPEGRPGGSANGRRAGCPCCATWRRRLPGRWLGPPSLGRRKPAHSGSRRPGEKDESEEKEYAFESRTNDEPGRATGNVVKTDVVNWGCAGVVHRGRARCTA